MLDPSDFSWEFSCPKFVDFTDSRLLDLNADDADSYFGLKEDSFLAQVENMVSPGITTPNRPGSASSNYRTPECSVELEADEVFYTTRKSYSLRETECRKLSQLGASPYRIPGGTTTGKKKSRRTPFQPKLVEENVQQIEVEELLAQNLKKALFIDNEVDKGEKSTYPINPSDNDDNKATEVIDSDENWTDASDERLPSNSDSFTESKVLNLNQVRINDENSNSTNSCIESNNSSVSIQSKNKVIILEDKDEKFTHPSNPGNGGDNIKATRGEIGSAEEWTDASDERLPSNSDSFTESKVLNLNQVRINDENSNSTNSCIESNNSSVSIQSKNKVIILEDKDEKFTHPSNPGNGGDNIKAIRGEIGSAEEWTDADDDPLQSKSDSQVKRRRPLRRESYVKLPAKSAAPATIVKKMNPQKQLYQRLSYTVPSGNKFRSLAELSRDFEQKIRVYTPNGKPETKSHWAPTKPVSPKLQAYKRNRTSTCANRIEQQGENSAQSTKKYTFRATPFNRKTYLSTINVGVKRVDPKPPTTPIPFSFRIEKRIEARRSKISADNQPKPVPKFSLVI